MTELTGIHAIIKGRVQGVYFRFETQKAALKLGVNGWVRNLPTGDVEAVFEAPSDKMDKMIKWCRQGSPASTVTDVVTTRTQKIEGYTTFDIRY